MFDIAFTFGRFNIPHNGHLSLFNVMKELGSQVIVGVSTGKNNVPIEERLKVFRLIAPDIIFLPMASPFKFETRGESTVIVLGEDQEKLANSLAAHLGAETFLHKRLTSSTYCRKLFASNDIEKIVEVIPPIAVEMCYNLYRIENNG